MTATTHTEQRRGDELPRPMKPNPWPGDENAYPCPWGCNGTGSMPWFAHVQGGVCFSCKGEGWILGRGSRPARAAAPAATERRPLRRWQRIGGRIVQVGEA